MERYALTCKDPGQFFRDCLGCKHYEKCDYFNKTERPSKWPKPTEVKNAKNKR